MRGGSVVQDRDALGSKRNVGPICGSTWRRPTRTSTRAALSSLAAASFDVGERDAAQHAAQRALAIYEETVGPDHPDVAVICRNLGGFALTRGELDDAERYYRRALEIAERTFGPTDVAVAGAARGLGAVAARRGDDPLARSFLERALAIHARPGGDVLELAETRFELAKSLWSDIDQRERARELATSAADGYQRAGRPTEVAAVQQWRDATPQADTPARWLRGAEHHEQSRIRREPHRRGFPTSNLLDADDPRSRPPPNAFPTSNLLSAQHEALREGLRLHPRDRARRRIESIHGRAGDLDQLEIEADVLAEPERVHDAVATQAIDAHRVAAVRTAQPTAGHLQIHAT